MYLKTYFDIVIPIETLNDTMPLLLYASILLSKCQPKLLPGWRYQFWYDPIIGGGFEYPPKLAVKAEKWGSIFLLYCLHMHGILAFKDERAKKQFQSRRNANKITEYHFGFLRMHVEAKGLVKSVN